MKRSSRYLLLAAPIFGGGILVFNIECRDAQEIYSVVTVATSVGIFTECRLDICRQDIHGLLGGIFFGCTQELLKSASQFVKEGLIDHSCCARVLLNTTA